MNPMVSTMSYLLGSLKNANIAEDFLRKENMSEVDQMSDIDIEQLTKGLSTSPDFIGALISLDSQLKKDPELEMTAIALSLFTMGYVSHMRFIEEKEKFRALNLPSYKDMQ